MRSHLMMAEENREPTIVGGVLKIGARVRFIPCACYVGEAGLTDHIMVERIGTVVYINEAHRWYCVEYLMGGMPDCIGHECFKY